MAEAPERAGASVLSNQLLLREGNSDLSVSSRRPALHPIPRGVERRPSFLSGHVQHRSLTAAPTHARASSKVIPVLSSVLCELAIRIPATAVGGMPPCTAAQIL